LYQKKKKLKNENIRELVFKISNLGNDIFLPGIELGAFIDVIATSITSNTHGKHHANLDLLVLRPSCSRKLGGIKVRWVIFVQNLSLSHLTENERKMEGRPGDGTLPKGDGEAQRWKG